MNKPTTINGYELAELLGSGGMGEVYRAVHPQIKRVVAIKLLKDSTGALRERSINEARIQAGLHHPNIAALHDFLEWQGQPCLILEYVDGQTLAELLETRQRFAPAEALKHFQAVVAAVAYLHEHKIIHRDIKANNIKLSTAGEIKLLDFGIAKDGAAPKMTMTGAFIGTLSCLAPEQLEGRADARSDVWALGVLLYQLVTGRLPFESQTLTQFYEQIRKCSYPAASQLNSAVPRALDELIAQCLKKNPAERPSDAGELLRAVQRLAQPAGQDAILSHKPIEPTLRPRLFYAVAFSLFAVVMSVILFWPTSSPPPSNAFVAPRPSATTTTPGELRTIHIDAVDGQAEVYQAGQRLGVTPHALHARVGERIALELRRDGAVRQVEFAVTDNRRSYTYAVK
ncbi:MAG: serine/threonine protein kinase [Acidobacteria bacterium]|nr:serine/threonine protein kinase [Acidobacteriota bacterium]